MRKKKKKQWKKLEPAKGGQSSRADDEHCGVDVLEGFDDLVLWVAFTEDLRA